MYSLWLASSLYNIIYFLIPYKSVNKVLIFDGINPTMIANMLFYCWYSLQDSWFYVPRFVSPIHNSHTRAPNYGLNITAAICILQGVKFWVCHKISQQPASTYSKYLWWCNVQSLKHICCSVLLIRFKLSASETRQLCMTSPLTA